MSAPTPLPDAPDSLAHWIHDLRPERALRARWHLDEGFVVLSHWRDAECVSTVRLDPASAQQLLEVLSAGLTDLVLPAPAAPADLDDEPTTLLPRPLPPQD